MHKLIFNFAFGLFIFSIIGIDQTGFAKSESSSNTNEQTKQIQTKQKTIDEIRKEKQEKSELRKILTDTQEVLGTFKIQGREFNVFSLPKWKFNLLDEIGANDEEKLLLLIINSLECGDEHATSEECIGADIGPFQINQVHREDYKVSSGMLNENDIEGLYSFQAQWTLDRIRNAKEKYCKGITGDKYISCQLKDHNRNNKYFSKFGMIMKDYYALKGLALKKELDSLIQ